MKLRGLIAQDRWTNIFLDVPVFLFIMALESSKFASHRARTSGVFNSRKDSNSTKFEQKLQIFVELSFREKCDSKLSGLHSFDNMALIHWFKKRSKTERLALSSWDTNLCSKFFDHHWELICCNKWHPEPQRYPYHTIGNICWDKFSCTTWHLNYTSIFTYWWYLLVATCKFGLLTIRSTI